MRRRSLHRSDCHNPIEVGRVVAKPRARRKATGARFRAGVHSADTPKRPKREKKTWQLAVDFSGKLNTSQARRMASKSSQRYDAMCRAIDAAHKVDEVKDIFPAPGRGSVMTSETRC
jgi:hypothetical protein